MRLDAVVAFQVNGPSFEFAFDYPKPFFDFPSPAVDFNDVRRIVVKVRAYGIETVKFPFFLYCAGV
jgi:hypothetical protein